jgi:hypothetical protein
MATFGPDRGAAHEHGILGCGIGLFGHLAHEASNGSGRVARVAVVRPIPVNCCIGTMPSKTSAVERGRVSSERSSRWTLIAAITSADVSDDCRGAIRNMDAVERRG